MLRFRFSSGLILGLFLGVPAGALVGLLILPPRTGDPNAATALQVHELTRKLEAAQDDKQRVDRQLEQFQKLAEQMTGSFNSLEQRFKALEEEQRLREARVDQAPAAKAAQPVALPSPTPGAPAAATQEGAAAAAMLPAAAAQ